MRNIRDNRTKMNFKSRKSKVIFILIFITLGLTTTPILGSNYESTSSSLQKISSIDDLALSPDNDTSLKLTASYFESSTNNSGNFEDSVVFTDDITIDLTSHYNSSYFVFLNDELLYLIISDYYPHPTNISQEILNSKTNFHNGHWGALNLELETTTRPDGNYNITFVAVSDKTGPTTLNQKANTISALYHNTLTFIVEFDTVALSAIDMILGFMFLIPITLILKKRK